MTEDLTPKHLRCGFGSFPSVHRTNDGNLVIVGEFAHMHAPGTVIGDLYDSLLNEQNVGKNEAVVVISTDLLGTLIEEKVREKFTRIAEKLQSRVDGCDRQRDDLLEEDVVGYATLNGVTMGLEVAIRALDNELSGKESSNEG